jgi:hypothetical protein
VVHTSKSGCSLTLSVVAATSSQVQKLVAAASLHFNPQHTMSPPPNILPLVFETP